MTESIKIKYHVENLERAMELAKTLLIRTETGKSKDGTHEVVKFFAATDTEIHKYKNKLVIVDGEFGERETIYFKGEATSK